MRVANHVPWSVVEALALMLSKRARNFGTRRASRGLSRKDHEMGSLSGLSNGAGSGWTGVWITGDRIDPPSTAAWPKALRNVLWKQGPEMPSPIVWL